MKKQIFITIMQCFCLVLIGFSKLVKADVVITLGGDLNLSPSAVDPDENGTCKHGQCYSWREFFSGLAPLLIGDLNFYNLETVVTDGNSTLTPKGGKYLFRSHIEGIRYAKKIGLNWISLANNHTGDYGVEGMLETLENLEKLSSEGGPLLYHGIARFKQDILQPSVVEIQSETEGRVRIAFAAITLVRNSSMQIDDFRPGLIYVENTKDLRTLLKNFRNTDAEFKVLSIHGGTEKKITLDSWQQERYRNYLAMGDLDLIIGHHPHRVRPVERIGNKVIFYSLGNYLMLGADVLNEREDAHDFGLMGRLYLQKNKIGRLEIKSVEAIPMFNMQAKVYPLVNEQAMRRIESLNILTEEQIGQSGVQWSFRSNGWGYVCFKDCEQNRVLY